MLNALTNSRFFSMLEVLTIFAMRTILRVVFSRGARGCSFTVNQWFAD
jgi:hypothetical protein